MWRQALNKFFLLAGFLAFFNGSAQAADLCANTTTCNVTTTGSAHLAGQGILPTASIGTALGSGSATPQTNSHDAAGQISVTSATAAANNTITTITFGGAQANTYATAPWCVITPANTNAAALSSANVPYVTSTTTGFSIYEPGTLANTTTYVWNWVCVQ
jgi:hypothetical protein